MRFLMIFLAVILMFPITSTLAENEDLNSGINNKSQPSMTDQKKEYKRTYMQENKEINKTFIDANLTIKEKHEARIKIRQEEEKKRQDLLREKKDEMKKRLKEKKEKADKIKQINQLTDEQKAELKKNEEKKEAEKEKIKIYRIGHKNKEKNFRTIPLTEHKIKPKPEANIDEPILEPSMTEPESTSIEPEVQQ